MARTLEFSFFMAVVVAVCACGGAAPPAETAAPRGSDPAAAAGEVTCTTPEGATAANPPTCDPGCKWTPEIAKCEPERGAIIPQ